MPNCGNSIGGSPYSFANQHAAPLVSEVNHSASRRLTTNHPSVTGASHEPPSSSCASLTPASLGLARGLDGPAHDGVVLPFGPHVAEAGLLEQAAGDAV